MFTYYGDTAVAGRGDVRRHSAPPTDRRYTLPQMGDLRYADAGVDIDEGNRAVSLIRRTIASTHTGQVLGGIGAFSGLFALEPGFAERPGPRLEHRLGRHQGQGRDRHRAAPRHRHRPRQPLRQRHPLLRRRAALLPRLLRHRQARPGAPRRAHRGHRRGLPRRGVRARSAARPRRCRASTRSATTTSPASSSAPSSATAIIDGSRVRAGDAALALPSSGLHTNGYSLVRHIVAEHELQWADVLPGTDRPLVDLLLEPHRCLSPRDPRAARADRHSCHGAHHRRRRHRQRAPRAPRGPCRDHRPFHAGTFRRSSTRHPEGGRRPSRGDVAHLQHGRRDGRDRSRRRPRRSPRLPASRSGASARWFRSRAHGGSSSGERAYPDRGAGVGSGDQPRGAARSRAGRPSFPARGGAGRLQPAPARPRSTSRASRGVTAVALPQSDFGGDATRPRPRDPRALPAAGVRLVVCAGYDRILSDEFLDAYPDAILNVHPSLLPAFARRHGRGRARRSRAASRSPAARCSCSSGARRTAGRSSSRPRSRSRRTTTSADAAPPHPRAASGSCCPQAVALWCTGRLAARRQSRPRAPGARGGAGLSMRALLSVSDKTGLVEFARGLRRARRRPGRHQQHRPRARRSGHRGAVGRRHHRLPGDARRARPDAAPGDPRGHPRPSRQPRAHAPARREPLRADRPRRLVPLPVRGHARERCGRGHDHREHRHRRPDAHPRRRQEPRLGRRGGLAVAVRAGARRAARARIALASRRGTGSPSRRSRTSPRTTRRSPRGCARGAADEALPRGAHRRRAAICTSFATARTRTSAARSTRSPDRPAAWRTRASCRARRCPSPTGSTSTPRARWSAEFDEPAACVIKHTNPCGFAVGETAGRRVPARLRVRSALRVRRHRRRQPADRPRHRDRAHRDVPRGRGVPRHRRRRGGASRHQAADARARRRPALAARSRSTSAASMAACSSRRATA